MILLSERPNREVKFLMAPRNYTAIYNQLALMLPPDLMVLFAKPMQKGHSTVWFANIDPNQASGNAISYDQLTEDQKNEVADILEVAQTKVSSILQKNPQAQEWVEELFVLPSTGSIKVFQTTNGLMVSLAEWGSRMLNASDALNPFTTVIRRPRPNRTKVTIQATFTNGNIANNQPFFFKIQNVVKQFKTNHQGSFNLGILPAGATFSIYEETDGEQKSLHHFEVREGQEIYPVQFEAVIPPARAKIRVIDQHGNPAPNLPLIIRTTQEQKSQTTNAAGEISLHEVMPGNFIEVNASNVSTGPQQFLITEKDEDNIFIYEIEIKEPQFVKVRLLDHKKRPLPAVPIDFFLDGKANQKTVKVTDEEAYCTFPVESFSNGQKVKANVIIHDTKKDKQKTHKKKFKYQEGQLAYTLQLRKPNYHWLWLLLLLLPLLLLLRFEKTIYVQTINPENKAISGGVEVLFAYDREMVFDTGHFFTNDRMVYSDSINEKGIATFATLEYSLYSLLFKSGSRTKIQAYSECFLSDTIQPAFHPLKNEEVLQLRLKPWLEPIDFEVVDTKDNALLPDAKVFIEAIFDGNSYIDSAITDPAGRVIFNAIPRCGTITKVVSTLDGYFPDSMLNRPVSDLLGNMDKKRRLRLTPITEMLEFYVVDCQTDRPIAGAEVTIKIEGRKEVQKRKTNVDGIGKGNFEEVHIISEVEMIAEAPPYYKSGQLPPHIVRDYIRLPKEERTICLEPIPSLVLFKNIDELTGAPIKGARNIVKIKNGDTKRVDTLYSDSKGNFPVSIIPGDQVSIIGTHRPDYEDNSDKIKEANGIKLKEGPQNERTIPLKPVMMDIVLRTINGDDGRPVPGADLRISLTYKGRALNLPTPRKSDQKGAFIVTAPQETIISVEASKPNYGSNKNHIRNETMKALFKAAQEKRDIPLLETLACNEAVSSGQGFSDELYFQLGSKNYDFTITADMKGHPDKMIIYCGKGRSGKVLFNEAIKKKEYSGTKVRYQARKCKGIITVVIEPTENDNSSNWEFEISCPN